ncbi:MAG TPA: GlsB/YeaQ/YmgE family stress response membrane protein [Blastocatellia bacterium]|nr:GlsB/YeaQ/YmgE family stress response membrane protein [Blastocatellia bacterium]
MGHLIGQIIFGLVVGIIAKFLMPGKDPGGFFITAIIGMVGALIGTFVGRALWGGAGYESGWIAAIFGAIILLAGYRLVMSRGTLASA